MRIASSALQLESTHVRQERHELQESMRLWIGDRRPSLENAPRNTGLPTAQLPEVQLSDAGKAAQKNEANAIQESADAVEKDPKLQLVKALVYMLTGREVKILDLSELEAAMSEAGSAPAGVPTEAPAQPQNAGWGFEYDRHEVYAESEQMTFSAAGAVKTSDGREISFSVGLSMSRSYYEESNIRIRAGDARQTKDPLVLNFAGTAAQLTSQRFKFDLDADGTADEINFVAGGSGFLAFDRSGDGVINNGSELFGALSGDGFTELAQYDSDHNGWIDENDPTYANLMVWTKDAAGADVLTGLKQANVGAIALARVETPFDLKTSTNELQGQIRSSGVFLREDGLAGTVQQVDLTV